MSLLGTLIRSITERNARGKSYTDFQRALVKTGETVHGRFQDAADTAGHRQAGRHIVGIERWSQSRLRAALGEAYLRDEYDSYQPGEELDMSSLAQAFAETRQGTERILTELEAAGVPLSKTVPHNQLGEMTIGGWLSYIIAHAGRESKRL